MGSISTKDLILNNIGTNNLILGSICTNELILNNIGTRNLILVVFALKT